VIGTMAVNLKNTVKGSGLLQRTVFADYGLSEADLANFMGLYANLAKNLSTKWIRGLQSTPIKIVKARSKRESAYTTTSRTVKIERIT
jgi:hypothetical protein